MYIYYLMLPKPTWIATYSSYSLKSTKAILVKKKKKAAFCFGSFPKCSCFSSISAASAHEHVNWSSHSQTENTEYSRWTVLLVNGYLFTWSAGFIDALLSFLKLLPSELQRNVCFSTVWWISSLASLLPHLCCPVAEESSNRTWTLFFFPPCFLKYQFFNGYSRADCIKNSF